MRRLTERGPCEILWTENKFKLDFKWPATQLKLVIKVPMFLSYLPPTLRCSLAIYTVGCLNCPSSPTKQPNSAVQWLCWAQYLALPSDETQQGSHQLPLKPRERKQITFCVIIYRNRKLASAHAKPTQRQGFIHIIKVLLEPILCLVL